MTTVELQGIREPTAARWRSFGWLVTSQSKSGRGAGALWRFTVEGTGRFPLDMLRYDGCWPTSSPAAMGIERTFTAARR